MLRLLYVLVLALFVGQTALAYAAPCIAADAASDHPCRDEDEDDKNCPCPIPCSPGCAGHALPAIPPSAPSFEQPLPVILEILLFSIERTPPPSEPSEILHVPKALCA